MTNHIEVKMTRLEDVKIPASVLRHHPPIKIKKLTKSMERYGIMVPVLVGRGGSIIEGVARYTRALRLSLNRLQQEAKWDKQAVATELRHLVEVGFDLDLTGFNTVEIENFFEIGEPEADVEDLNVSTLALAAVSQIGEIWGLKGNHGEHRIACGDFRDPHLRKTLFAGASASASISDSPYNVRIEGHVSGTGKHKEFAHASGEMTDQEFEVFLIKLCEATLQHLNPNSVTFLFMDWRHIQILLNVSTKAGLELLNIAVWTKTNPGMGSFYRSQHELVAVFKRHGESYRNNIQLGRHGRSRSNVWPYRGVNVFGSERYLLDAHPTPKPSALVADAIRDVTLPGEIVFDAFLGSGTTLIAAERTHRRCYATEIEPIYVDLAIRRWQLETGLTAVRLSDGTSFTEVENAAHQAEAVEGSVQP